MWISSSPAISNKLSTCGCKYRFGSFKFPLLSRIEENTRGYSFSIGRQPFPASKAGRQNLSFALGKEMYRSIEKQISYFPFEATKTRVHQLFNRIKSHARVSNSIQIRFPRNLSISFSKRNQLGHSPRPKRNLAIATNVDHLVVFLESTRSTKTQIHSSAADNNPLERTSSPRSDNFFRFPIWNRNGKKKEGEVYFRGHIGIGYSRPLIEYYSSSSNP